MARRVKLLICLGLLSFAACGVKGPVTPYLDVVAKENAQALAQSKKEEPSPTATPVPSPKPETKATKKKETKKKK